MKKCTKCGIEKPLSDFHKNKSTKDKYCSLCKSCNNKHAAAWNKKQTQKRKIIVQKNNYKKRYGLTVEQKQDLIDGQDSKCAICKNDLKDTHDVCVDHNHITGSIRGILCRKCNLGIGHLQDSIDILKSAVKYLKKYSADSAKK
jgi:hypothetical protein